MKKYDIPWPVIPMWRLPSPTYFAISAAGKKTIVTGKSEQAAISSLCVLWNFNPMPSKSFLMKKKEKRKIKVWRFKFWTKI